MNLAPEKRYSVDRAEANRRAPWPSLRRLWTERHRRLTPEEARWLSGVVDRVVSSVETRWSYR